MILKDGKNGPHTLMIAAIRRMKTVDTKTSIADMVVLRAPTPTKIIMSLGMISLHANSSKESSKDMTMIGSIRSHQDRRRNLVGANSKGTKGSFTATA